MGGGLSRLLGAPRDYATHLRRALTRLRRDRIEPPLVVQGVVLDGDRVLLAVRADLRGWELPGGHIAAGESEADGLAREIEEETGIQVVVGELVGEYRRTGFLPHRARVYRCRPRGGELRPSAEAPVVRWWSTAALPEATLFPWFRGPLEDALSGEASQPVERQEHQGLAAIWAGLRIDLRMRFVGDVSLDDDGGAL